MSEMSISKPKVYRPEPYFTEEHPDRRRVGKPRCTAWSRSKGQQCGNVVKEVGKKCRFHGGASPTGLSSPATKTGRYSKHLPTRLAALHEKSLMDHELMSLREDIALTSAQILWYLESIDDPDVADAVKELQRHKAALIEKERRIAETNETYLHIDEVAMLMRTYGALVRETVERRAFQDGFDAEPVIRDFDRALTRTFGLGM